MDQAVKEELLQVYADALQPPWTGSVWQWCEHYIELPNAYAIPGKFSMDNSPYLIQPFEDLKNPNVRMVNLVAATQIGKSLLAELFIPYIVCNDPGPTLRLHQNDDMAATFTETRLIPLLKATPQVKAMLGYNRFAATKKGITLPHMSVKVSSAKETVLHGQSIRFLLLDETHLYEFGTIEKAIARTTAFAGRRKIVVSSQPNRKGSELEKYYNMGQIFEWQWQCPGCKKHQPYRWTWQRKDLSYAGINFETILNEDKETTNIGLSAKTAWLECFFCAHKVKDSLENRRLLNDTARYECIKSDGDPEIHSYTIPQFVNINISFASMVVQYLNAKKMKTMTGLDEDMVTFENQILGKFYHAGITADHSKIMRGDYSPDPSKVDKEWLPIMTVDYQRVGKIKYYVVRAWHRNGNESRRLDFGVARTWEEIDAIAKKWGVAYPCVGVDEGDGETTSEVRQECVKHGQVLKLPNGTLEYICWTSLKGDAKLSWTDHPDKISRFYSPQKKADAMFPIGSKYKGVPAPLHHWSNYSIKTILMNLRDNKIPGVKWLVDVKDAEYEKQMYSEGLMTQIDKKTGQTVSRWVQIGEANHWLDCEAMNLTQAVRANVFSATKVNEEELKKVVDKLKPEEKKTEVVSV